MGDIRKVPASAGADWLLTGFGLLKRAPLALGSLGILWAVGTSLAMSLAMQVPVLWTPVQFVLLLAGPLFMGGLLWAVREVDEGRAARPSHLLEGLREGRAPHLLVAVLPQVVAAVLLGSLLLVLIGGPEGLQKLSEVMLKLNEMSQSGQQPDPAQIEALVSTLPAARLLLWLLLFVVVLVALPLALFMMLPQVMFERAGGWQALRRSLRACLRNLPAMGVFLVLSFIALFVIYFAVMIVALVVSVVAGQAAAVALAQLLLMAVLMPVFGGATYAAWKQMLGPGAAMPPPVSGGHVFEA